MSALAVVAAFMFLGGALVWWSLWLIVGGILRALSGVAVGALAVIALLVGAALLIGRVI
jgi:hypothetical protein